MTEKETENNIRSSLSRAWQSFDATISSFDARFRNLMRRWRGQKIDFVVLTVSGSLPERAAPKPGFIARRLPWTSQSAMSLEEFNQRLLRIADADNTRGVILVFQRLTAGMATLDNLRQSINRLRQAGKQVVVYTPYLDLKHYYVATAASQIVSPPSARFEVLGLNIEATFLKDALARVGVQADVIQISPYKTAMDQLGRSDMSPEAREQFNWLLDDQYDLITAAIANGRGLEQDKVKALIDEAPFSVSRAQEAGLIDHVAYDDELPELLAEKSNEEVTSSDKIDVDSPPRTSLKTWSEARKLLIEKPRQLTRNYIGVISLEGAITMGASRVPPISPPIPVPIVGSAIAGEQTLVRLLRKAEEQSRMSALIFYVNSPGGDALASDLIARQLEQLAAKIPVVVYMGNYAASGGYYVAAPAHHIISSPATITGSIGVIAAHLSTKGLLDLLSVHQESVQRGQHANLYTDPAPLSEADAAIYHHSINEIYTQFKEAVTRGRHIPLDEIDPIAEGRVWTGRQAQARILVDTLGDFNEAVRVAAELGNLPMEDLNAIRVVNIYPKDSSYIVPAEPATAVLARLGQWLAGEFLNELNGRPLFLMPFDIKFK